MQFAPEIQSASSGEVRTPVRHAPAEGWTLTADRIAIAVSAVCAVHCAVTPVVLAVLPFLGSTKLEFGIRLCAVTLGLLGIGFGSVIHKSTRSLPYLVVALALFGWLTVNHGVAQYEEQLSVLASLVLMAGHWINLKTAKAACASHDHGRWGG